jgi:hypothetical protein
MMALMAALGCQSLPRRGEAVLQVSGHKPDFAVSGIDPMPVGTAGQVTRMKRARAERKI